MSTETTWVCDGCGARHVGPYKPANWAVLSITIKSSHTFDEYEDRGDFCEACRDRIATRARLTNLRDPAPKESP